MAASALPVNVYVAGIPTSVDDSQLKTIFEKYGAIESVKILQDPVTKASRGVGFVNFKKHEDAANAIGGMNGTKLNAPTTNRPQALQVKFANAKGSGSSAFGAVATPDGYGPAKNKPASARFHPFDAVAGVAGVEGVSQNNVYVCGFPKTWKKEDLMDTFKTFGTISSTKVLEDPTTGQGRGVGFVRFSSYEEAQKAIEQMNGKTTVGGDQPLQVRFAKDAKKTDLTTVGAMMVYPSADPTAYVDPTAFVEMKVEWPASADPMQLAAYGAYPGYFYGTPDQAVAFADPSAAAPPGVVAPGAPGVPDASPYGFPGFPPAPPSVPGGGPPPPQPYMPYPPVQGPPPGPGFASYPPPPPPGAGAGGGYPHFPSQDIPPSPPSAGSYPPPPPPPPYGSYPPPPPDGGFGPPPQGQYPPPPQPQGDFPPGVGLPPGMAPGIPPPGMASSVPLGLPLGDGMAMLMAAAPQIPLFVLHLPIDMKEDELETLFKEHGRVLSAKVMTDPATGKSKGYGFVNMATMEEAQTAIISLQGHKIRNKYLRVSLKSDKSTPTIASGI